VSCMLVLMFAGGLGDLYTEDSMYVLLWTLASMVIVSNTLSIKVESSAASLNVMALVQVCRNYANFLCMVPILHRFRIVRCNRLAALYSVQFNYTPLEIRRTDKKKQLTIVKPTQTGINRNK
jgi:hypothetical protein